jgi:hypothetical protein
MMENLKSHNLDELGAPESLALSGFIAPDAMYLCTHWGIIRFPILNMPP